MRFYIAFLSMVFLVQQAVAAETPRIKFGSFGKIQVGMTPEQVSKIYQVERDRPYEADEQCYYLITKNQNKNRLIYFMITDGKVSRIDIDNTGIFTSEGIQVGDSEDHVKEVYKGIAVEPHHYVAPEGNYLTVNNPDRKLAIRFETYQGKVTGYYTGKYPEVEYVEGCE